MAYDAVNMQDWQISEEAEKNMPMPEQWREKLGLQQDEMLPMGRLSKIDFLKVINSDDSHRFFTFIENFKIFCITRTN